MRIALNNYLDRKGLPDPLDPEYKPVAFPVYNPKAQIPPSDESNNFPPPFNGGNGGDISHPPNGNINFQGN